LPGSAWQPPEECVLPKPLKKPRLMLEHQPGKLPVLV